MSEREIVVYFFANGKADGNASMKDTLGGKGAGLAEMTNAGLPVPPGFTISTNACREYLTHKNHTSTKVNQETFKALAWLERVSKQKFGSLTNPLLVSVRSGAKFSMPGMMDTILNLGLNDKTVGTLARRSQNPRFAWDCYRRLIQMFGEVVFKISRTAFDDVFDDIKAKEKAEADTDLSAKALMEMVVCYKGIVEKETGQAFPQEPRKQLQMARDAVFQSWNTPRAITYRKMNSIPYDLGTAVTVQLMVFGNMGNDCGTGVAFTRNPSTGNREFYGEYLLNSQGEDVVAGIRTPVPIAKLRKKMPAVYKQLIRIAQRLEKHYRDMQDFEFTIQGGKLYMLQTRTGKRTGQAALKIAHEMVKEKLITKEEAVLRVASGQFKQLMHPVIAVTGKLEVIAKGLPASPGTVAGRIVFTADEAVEKSADGPVVLVRSETVPDDIHGMQAAVGILTSRGGLTSHAAVVARSMDKCCIVGCDAIQPNEKERTLSVEGYTLGGNDWLSLDGNTGRVILGQAYTLNPSKG